MTLYLVCDETGSKGYSDKHEKYPGDFGLFVGLLLNEEKYHEYLNLMEEIKEKYFQGIDKVHISDAKPGDQDSIRQIVHKFILDHEIPVIFEGIYAQGFNESVSRREALRVSAKELVEEQSDIKINSRELKESLHVDLFEGLFVKGVEYYENNHGDEPFIIITDPVDEPIKASFVSSIRNLINLGEPKIYTTKAFRPSTKTPISSNTKISSSQNYYKPNVDMENVCLRIESKVHALGPDVVASSLEYHVRQINQNRLTSGGTLVGLNGRDAVSGHPLEGCFKCIDNNNFTDKEYDHPGANEGVKKLIENTKYVQVYKVNFEIFKSEGCKFKSVLTSGSRGGAFQHFQVPQEPGLSPVVMFLNKKLVAKLPADNIKRLNEKYEEFKKNHTKTLNDNQVIWSRNASQEK